MVPPSMEQPQLQQQTAQPQPEMPAPPPPQLPPHIVKWRTRPPPLPWMPLLSPAQLRRGLGFYGSGTRIERVAAALMAGQPVTAVVVGGSISKGAGSSREPLAFPARFFEFLNATFPNRYCGGDVVSTMLYCCCTAAAAAVVLQSVSRMFHRHSFNIPLPSPQPPRVPEQGHGRHHQRHFRHLRRKAGAS